MLEPTDEMVNAVARRIYGEQYNLANLRAIRDGLTDALAIVERDHSVGPAICDEPHPTEDLAFCELVRGHAARSGRGHSATVTRAVDW